MVSKCCYTLRDQILVNFGHIFINSQSKPGNFQEKSNFLEEISWSLFSCFLVFYQEMCNSSGTCNFQFGKLSTLEEALINTDKATRLHFWPRYLLQIIGSRLLNGHSFRAFLKFGTLGKLLVLLFAIGIHRILANFGDFGHIFDLIIMLFSCSMLEQF